MRRAAALAGVLVLAGCGPGAPGEAYRGAHRAEAGPSALAGAPRAMVELREVAEVPNVAPGMIGEMRDRDGRLVKLLRLEPTPGRRMTDALRAELLAAGHLPVGAGGAAVLEGAVQRFEFTSVPGSLVWNAGLQAVVTVTLRFRDLRESRAYTARCDDAGMLGGAEEASEGVAARCITSIARQFRDDRAMARVLSGG